MTATTSTYEIQSDIPLPRLVCGRDSYPFASMAVGDSFALESNDIKNVQRVRTAASWYGLRNEPVKFAVRRVDPITKQYRCWRIA
jgi:hypothetical protein